MAAMLLGFTYNVDALKFTSITAQHKHKRCLEIVKNTYISFIVAVAGWFDADINISVTQKVE